MQLVGSLGDEAAQGRYRARFQPFNLAGIENPDPSRIGGNPKGKVFPGKLFLCRTVPLLFIIHHG